MKPYIIAELSANHCQSLDVAHALVEAAAEAGANAIKLQTFNPESMVLDTAYRLTAGPWKGKLLIDLYREAHTPWEWHQPLFDYARKLKLEAFSTVYDREGVDFLESIGCPKYKISSFEVPDLDLIRYVASKGKPMIVSTGMASFAEIQNIMQIVGHQAKVTLMKCTSAYPAEPSDANLETIRDMAQHFFQCGLHCDIGLSDHTLGSAVACVAVALGASVFEKHLKLDDSFPSPDSRFSTIPAEFKEYVRDINDAWLAVGAVHYGPTESEMPSFSLRRSLYFTHDLEVGTVLTAAHFRTVRPAEGIAPDRWQILIGKRLTTSVRAGQPISWGLIRE